MRMRETAQNLTPLLLTVAAWVAAILVPIFAADFFGWNYTLIFGAMMGFALTLQTNWITREGSGFDLRKRQSEGVPSRHLLRFFLFSLVGGPVVIGAHIWVPEITTLAVISGCSNFIFVTILPGLRDRLFDLVGDERFRANQLAARNFGLQVALVLAMALVILDVARPGAMPLWMGAVLIAWAFAVSITGKLWWLERGADD